MINAKDLTMIAFVITSKARFVIRSVTYLVEKVDLGDGVLLVAGVIHQQGVQAHKRYKVWKHFAGT